MHKTTLLSLSTLLSLHASPIYLGKIDVTTPSNTPQNIATTTTALEIINAHELHDREYINLNDALKSIGGVDIQSSGGVGTQSTVTIDGMSGKNILILIDGMSYNDPSTINNTSPLEHLLLDNIERIEILKGSQSAIWGSNASGGVINIITKTPPQGTHGSLDWSIGSFATHQTKLNLSHQGERFYINLNHSQLKSDSFSSLVPPKQNPKDYEADAYNNRTASLKMGLRIDKNNQLEALFKMIDTALKSDPFGDPDGVYDVDTQDRFYRIKYTHYNDWGEFELYGQKSTFAREYLDELWGVPRYDGQTQEIGARFNRHYNQKDFFAVQALYKTFEHANAIDQKYANASLSITNTNTVGKSVITESIRHDSYDTFEDKTTIKLGIKHALNRDLSISTNYATAYNVPTLYQLYAPDTSWGKMGNSTLTPEKVQSFDAGVAYCGLNLRYFYNTIDNRIDFGNGYINAQGKNTIKGVEVGYKQSFGDTLWLSLNYTRINAKDAKDEDILRIAQDSLKIALDYHLDRWHIGASYRYIGSKKDLKFNPDFTSEVVENGKYGIVDAIIDYDLSDTSKLYLKANNVLNTRYQEFYGYGSSSRAIYGGIRFEF